MRSVVLLVALALAGCSDTSFEDGVRGEGESGCGDAAEGAVDCDGDGAQVCREGGWNRLDCDGGCEDDGCGENACPDEIESTCGGDGSIRTCYPSVGGWEFSYCDAGQTCVGDECVTAFCLPGQLYCGSGDADTFIFQCNDNGTEAERVDTCGGSTVCSGGACISACQKAESTFSFVGCTYYALDTDNNAFDGFAANDPLQYDVVVSNPGDAEASVLVQEKTGGAWETIRTVAVTSRGIAIIPLTCSERCQGGNLRADRHPEDTTVARGYAFRLQSDVPIIAYQFNSDDLDGSASSSGATILMPKTALDIEYYAVTLPQSGDDRAWVAVVAVEDGTSVTVTAASATAAGGGVTAMGPGDDQTITIDDGDVLQVSSASPGDDLSGSHVTADKPVAVFAGNECARLGGGSCDGADFSGNGGDHTEEQMMPVITWGKQFVAAHVRHPQQADLERAVWKIVAAEAGTVVSFAPGADVLGLPAEPISLGAGGVTAFESRGAAGGHFFISSSLAVQVVQYMRGETAALVVVPTEQYLPEYVFLAPPFFVDTLTIVRQSGTSVALDGTAVAGSWFNAGGGFEATWRDDLEDGSHTVTIEGGLKGQNAGIQLTGMDSNCSYGYLGGLNALRINVPQ
ncbi:MAG: IgGFc-binding protein [Myxococcota bacterium]